jgi:mycothiol synthase
MRQRVVPSGALVRTGDNQMISSQLRPLRDEDAEQVAAPYARAFGEWRELDAEEIRSWLRNEELKPELLRVLEIDGRVVGYGDIEIHENEVALDVAAPEQWKPFLDWAEETGRANRKPRVRVYSPADHELAGIVRRRGYRLWRSTFTMETRLDDPAPAMLPGLQLRTYRPDVDETKLRATFNEAFADDPFHHHLLTSRFREFYLKARGYDPSLWLLAWDGGELAGFVLAYPEHAGNTELGWINVLGVRTAWRNRGVGEALLRSAFREPHARGLRRAGLGVDAENVTGALRLYERVGMRVVSRGDNYVLQLATSPVSRQPRP